MNIYQVSIPVFLRGLDILSELLHKGEVHDKATGADPDALVSRRLAPDMLTLAGQVQGACATAKSAASRLTGTQSPVDPDEETNFADLQDRIARTIDLLRSFRE